jgi:glutathione peroxidase
MMLGSLLFGIAATATAAATPKDIYDLSFQTIDGQPMPLSQYRGKVLVIVNTASRCGFTPQYTALQKLYDTYKSQGLVVLGVPSNDFGGQEPGTAKEIKHFCQTNFNITFPLASKEVVSGNNAHPFYQQVRAQLGILAVPRWNFYKYVISRDGHIVAWFSSLTKPDAPKLMKAVERELAKPADTAGKR